MSDLFPQGIQTDGVANKRDGLPLPKTGTQFGNLLGTSAFVSTAVGTAAVVAVTLAGSTSNYTMLDYLGISTAGFTGEATSSSVFVTIYDGSPSTTPLGSFVISKNVNLDNVLSGVHATSATTGNGISIHASAGATGVSVALTARKKFVKA